MKYFKLILIFILLKINIKYVFNLIDESNKDNIIVRFELKSFFKSVINQNAI